MGVHFAAITKANPTVALPVSRITKDQPFTFTGVDFAGTLYEKEHGDMCKTTLEQFQELLT